MQSQLTPCVSEAGMPYYWQAGDRTTNKLMTLNQVRALLATEKAAKDAFYAANKTRTATKAQHDAMVAATKARQAAMTAYAATL